MFRRSKAAEQILMPSFCKKALCNAEDAAATLVLLIISFEDEKSFCLPKDNPGLLAYRGRSHKRRDTTWSILPSLSLVF